MKRYFPIYLAWFAFLVVSCQETNPYSDGMRRSGLAEPEGSADQSSNRNSEVQNNANESQNSNEEDIQLAEEDEIAEVAKTSVQTICGNQKFATDFPVEMPYLCLNGQATQNFASLLASPYQGAQQLPPRILKSEDVNGVSHLISVASLKIAKPISDIFARRAQMNSFSVTAGGATFSIAPERENPAAGNGHLGGFDVATRMRISVGIITINDTALQVRDLIDLSGDQSIIADAAYLKPNDPANNAAILSNNLSFWISEGNTTTLIVVTHQQIANRGQHARASATFGDISSAIDREMFNILSN